MGKLSKVRNFIVNGGALGSAVVQRDLEVQVHISLKVASRVDMVAKKTFSTIAFIKHGIVYRGSDKSYI